MRDDRRLLAQRQVLRDPSGFRSRLLSILVQSRAGAEIVLADEAYAAAFGSNGRQVAVGLGAEVTIPGRNVDRLRQLDMIFGNRVTTLYSSVAPWRRPQCPLIAEVRCR